MNTETFTIGHGTQKTEYTMLYEKDDWAIIRFEGYPNVGISHKCNKCTWTQQITRISHMFIRNSSNYTCVHCHKELPEGIYALWSMMNWDCDGDLLVTPFDSGTIHTPIT